MDQSRTPQDKLSDCCEHGNRPGNCKQCNEQNTPTETNQDSEKEIANMLEQIKNAEPEIEWQTYIPDKQFGVVIKLPHECFISATLNIDDAGSRRMYIDIFQANKKLRGTARGDSSGIGKRLLTSLVEEAKKYNVTKLAGHTTSKSALATRARVCGQENLAFYKHGTIKKVNNQYN